MAVEHPGRRRVGNTRPLGNLLRDVLALNPTNGTRGAGAGQPNLHVRGYKERGHINTPLELAIENEIDRFSLAIDVIDRVPRLRARGAHAKEKLRGLQIDLLHGARARRRSARAGRLELALLEAAPARPA